MTSVPKYAATETWSDERLAWAELAKAIRAGTRFQLSMDRVRAAFAGTPSLPPDPVERDRAAVTAVVAGWDTREPRCEHGATVTGPARVVSTSGHIVGTLVSPLTYCLDCHQLTPAQED